MLPVEEDHAAGLIGCNDDYHEDDGERDSGLEDDDSDYDEHLVYRLIQK